MLPSTRPLMICCNKVSMRGGLQIGGLDGLGSRALAGTRSGQRRPGKARIVGRPVARKRGWIPPERARKNPRSGGCRAAVGRLSGGAWVALGWRLGGAWVANPGLSSSGNRSRPRGGQGGGGLSGGGQARASSLRRRSSASRSPMRNSRPRGTG